MVIDAAVYAWKRYRPQEGWLAVALLLAVVLLMIYMVLDVHWVPEDSVVVPAALWGLLLGIALAKRPVPAWMAWSLIILYGFLITTLTLANLWPPLNLLFSDWHGLRLYWLENGAEFLDRTGGWFTAVFAGSRSNETIIFAYLMGLMAWFLAAYAAWSAFRQRRPLLGLTLMGLVVAINGYYGVVPISQVISFVGVALLATAALHYANLEWSWQQDKVDYSGEIRLELVAYAFVIGLALLALAYVIPTLNPSRWARALLNQPLVTDVEESLERAFAGIEPPRTRPIAPGAAGGAGIMPRSFLLGNPPELERNIMLTARTELVNAPQTVSPGLLSHWRGLSYEVYTGRGWTLTEEQWRAHEANELIPLQPVSGSISLKQEVNWRFDDRIIRYTVGFPYLFDQPVITYWRGQTDFVRVASRDIPRYEVTSLVAAATPDQLRQVSLDDIDANIVQRYTQLPGELPQRVVDLAAEVTQGAETPYDQAVALERFLRQYAYSLDIELPPEGADAVDYFLFDLQMGYCDYYASAMAVMARALGIPARIATGFLAQPADESGVQTVRQINGHSWTEIYFEDYGWVEFEPTAAFITPHDPLLPGDAASSAGQFDRDSSAMETASIPQRAPQPERPWPTIILVSGALLLGGALIAWWIRRPKYEDDVQFAYSRLQENARRLGHSLPPSQTPAEFKTELLEDLDQLSTRPVLKSLIEPIWSPVTLLTNLFIQQRYSGQPVPNPREAISLWRRIRQPLFMLWLHKRLRRIEDNKEKS